MKNYEFNGLKNNFSRISEAIKLYDTGNHPEYDKYTLDELLDGVHIELCEAASMLAQELISAIDAGEEVSEEDKNYLEALFYMASECYDYCYEYECFDLKEGYGNGVIDSIGADFTVIKAERSRFKYFDYAGFANLLETYEIMDY